MKTLLLTGGSGEIGKAISQVFMNNQYQVIAPDRKEMNLENPEAINAYINKLDIAFDAFVHCAGMNDPKLISKIMLEDVQKTLQTNAVSFYSITHVLINEAKIKKDGHILGISSIYGSLARPGRFSYVASKHCLNGMIKSLAVELGALNIKANTVSPGFVDTKMTRKNNTQEVIDGFAKKIPLNRLATPEDIANVVYFMCSAQNTFINGQDIIVDGGYSIGGFEK